MASSMPEIGSKISLISKADIRYEGKLFTVDPNECTIALSHVRSFGTEDRQTQYPVPAQSQVYEYILFRGSDIKDISIVNTQQLPNDPAIVSGMAPSMPSNYPGHSYSHHPVMSAPMAPPQYPNYMAPGMGRSLSKQAMSSELVNVNPQETVPGHTVPVPVQVHAPPVIPIVKEPTTELLGGSRSSTPSLSRKSPTIDQAVQVSPHKDKKPIQPPAPREGRQNRSDRNYQETYQRRDFRGQRDGQNNMRDNEYRGQRDGQNNMRDNEYRGQRERDGDYRVQRDQDNRRDGFTSHPQQQQQRQGQGMNRGGWVNRGRGGAGPSIRSRGRGGPGGNFNRAPGSGPQNQPQQNNTAAVKKNTLKFDEEYDFDKANSEFEELRSKTAKLKISGEGEAAAPKVNGEDKKDDSGNETGLGEGEPEEDPEHEHVVYYDKTKSFFDNISCEAVERSKGRSQRTDWRTERKLNSETFGVASARRGGYRGRGGYYGGRGMYRGYRGYNMRGQTNRNPQSRPPPTTQQTSTPPAK
ncbi:protein LSM14 homolog B-like isoform X2 [Homalodisca vitripennis]|uniref:protein LSM14 homolog B-like isoform X2 n=1 Tax=Homalodisca vitripennis TaxID=197043 RepID=UPI001EEB0F2F|nr:protein LSM14 homolog B-like isoform X2 [Homalodisca vitripennis]